MTDKPPNLPENIYLICGINSISVNNETWVLQGMWTDLQPEGYIEKYIRSDLVETTTEERKAALEAVQGWFNSINYTAGKTKEKFKFVDGEKVMYEHGETIRTALQAKTVPMSVADELAEVLKDCKFQCDEDLEKIADEVLSNYNKFKEQK